MENALVLVLPWVIIPSMGIIYDIPHRIIALSYPPNSVADHYVQMHYHQNHKIVMPSNHQNTYHSL